MSFCQTPSASDDCRMMNIDTSTTKIYEVVVFTATAHGGSTISVMLFFKVVDEETVVICS